MGKQSEASLHVVGSWGLGAWKGARGTPLAYFAV